MQTVEEIAKALGADAAGDTSLVISGVNTPARAEYDELALGMDPSYEQALKSSKAQAAFVWPDADWQALGFKAAISGNAVSTWSIVMVG